jgi:heme o synthase
MTKLQGYVALTKPRLSFLVVISAISGYLLAGWDQGSFLDFICMVLGGFFITGASNGLNQLIERDIDQKMSRTESRPLPKGVLSVKQALVACLVYTLLGVVLLFNVNFTCLLLGFGSLIVYVFMYTPLKQKTPWATFVGAIPGAMPPLLGWVAATNDFGLESGILYFVQFVWQFPHFWAIAWVLYDDYNKAGISLLPTKKKDKSSAFLVLIYSGLMIPTSLIPWVLPLGEVMISDVSAVIVLIAGLLFCVPSYKLYKNLEDSDAKKVMFASFIYLPVVQFAYLIK